MAAVAGFVHLAYGGLRLEHLFSFGMGRRATARGNGIVIEAADVADFFLCSNDGGDGAPVCGTARAEGERFTLLVRRPGVDQPTELSFPSDAPVAEVFRALVRRMA